MAHFYPSGTQNSTSKVKVNTPKKVQDNALKDAVALQVELGKRASTPLSDDPLLSFDSSMTREQVRAKFLQLVQRSREAVFA